MIKHETSFRHQLPLEVNAYDFNFLLGYALKYHQPDASSEEDILAESTIRTHMKETAKTDSYGRVQSANLTDLVQGLLNNPSTDSEPVSVFHMLRRVDDLHDISTEEFTGHIAKNGIRVEPKAPHLFFTQKPALSFANLGKNYTEKMNAIIVQDNRHADFNAKEKLRESFKQHGKEVYTIETLTALYGPTAYDGYERGIQHALRVS